MLAKMSLPSFCECPACALLSGVPGEMIRADRQGIVNLIFSLDEFSPLQPISRDQSDMYEREKREEAPLLSFIP